MYLNKLLEYLEECKKTKEKYGKISITQTNELISNEIMQLTKQNEVLVDVGDNNLRHATIVTTKFNISNFIKNQKQILKNIEQLLNEIADDK